MHLSLINDVEIEPDEHINVHYLWPTEMDVLCGPGRNYDRHPGNLIYRQLIVQYIPIYVQCKHETVSITKLIVSTMQNEYKSRFLRRNRDNNGWEVLTNAQARDKTSHGLRINGYNQITLVHNNNVDDNDNYDTTNNHIHWNHQSNQNGFTNFGNNNDNDDDDDNDNTIVSTLERTHL